MYVFQELWKRLFWDLRQGQGQSGQKEARQRVGSCYFESLLSCKWRIFYLIAFCDERAAWLWHWRNEAWGDWVIFPRWHCFKEMILNSWQSDSRTNVLCPPLGPAALFKQWDLCQAVGVENHDNAIGAIRNKGLEIKAAGSALDESGKGLIGAGVCVRRQWEIKTCC